jgi:CheY-like chemotaxis protein
MPASKNKKVADILIVEDEMIGAAHIKSIVEELGFRVAGIATTIDSALDLIQSGQKIDCATLDVRLGEGLSSPIASSLLARDIPFVICSAYNIFLRDFPTVPILQKPFTAEELGDALSRAMSIG